MFNTNQKIKVSNSSPIHMGRIGYYQGIDDSLSDDIAVLSTTPVYEDGLETPIYFAVNKNFIEEYDEPI